MSKKRVHWFSPSIKALLLAGIFHFFAKLFLRSAEKMSGEKQSKKKKEKSI